MARATGDVLFGRALRAARQARGLSAAELARRLGVGLSRVRQWEGAHKAMPAELLPRLERELQVRFAGVSRVRKPHHPLPSCRIDLAGIAEAVVTCRSTGNVIWRAIGPRAVTAAPARGRP